MYYIEVKYSDNCNKFRPASMYFKEHGHYCSYPRGTTVYKKFWDEEFRRCTDGYRTEDGDYISGYYYFYLNYCPIYLTRQKEYKAPNGKMIMKTIRIQDFPDFYDYDRTFFEYLEECENNDKHGCVIKKRKSGYSFKGASILCRNYFFIKGSTNIVVASNLEFLTKDGIITKAWDIISFVDENTPFKKKRDKVDTKMHKRASIVVNREGIKTELGYKSEIIGITTGDDVQKIRGKRAKIILFEEGGMFPDLKVAWNIARSSVEDEGGGTFGTMLLWGTGGVEGGNFEGLKDIFYEPNAYNCLEVKNVWDENVSSNSICGFFVPQYYNMNGTDDQGRVFMDENGNSNVELSLQHEQIQRDKIIKNASDRNAIDRYIAEKPLTPAEAVLVVSKNIFPKKELMAQLSWIRVNRSVATYKQVGDLIINGTGVVEFVQSDKPEDITKYRLTDKDNKKGQIVIWEHPVENPPYGLYVGGCLPPGEKVVTASGLKNVEDVTLYDKLINKDGKLVNIINRQVRYKTEHDLYNFKMSNSYRTTSFTRGHPLFVSNHSLNSNNTINENGFNFKFTRADKVKVGDWTMWPNLYKSQNEIDINDFWPKPTNKYERRVFIESLLDSKDFWWFIGLWLGDGCCYSQTIDLSFNESEIYYISKTIIIIETLFKRKPLITRNKRNCVTISFNSKQLDIFLTSNFGKYANGKFLPEWVKRIDSSFKHNMLLGYLASDGCVTKHTKGYYSIEFVSISLLLLEGFQDILFSLDIISGISKMRDSKIITILNRPVNQQECYHLRLSHHSVIKFAEIVNDLDDIKLKRVDFINQPKIRRKPKDGCFISECGNYIYFQIREIVHSLYTGVVYNFECETHNYISHHISQKNCDPYDHDEANSSSSLGSIIIWKRIHIGAENEDMMVAEYTGRPDSSNEFYENCRKLLIYYHGVALYENQNKGLFVYFSQKHCEYLLADQPSIIRDIIQDSNVHRGKGIHMNKDIKKWGELRIRDWLNDTYQAEKKNLTKIFSEPLLEELIAFGPDVNTDRVMALMCVIIYKEQLYHHKVKKDSTESIIKLFDKPLFDTTFVNNDKTTNLINFKNA
jgi:hypothetical protein